MSGDVWVAAGTRRRGGRHAIKRGDRTRRRALLTRRIEIPSSEPNPMGLVPRAEATLKNLETKQLMVKKPPQFADRCSASIGTRRDPAHHSSAAGVTVRESAPRSPRK
jgi:hypothetical protein